MRPNEGLAKEVRDFEKSLGGYGHDTRERTMRAYVELRKAAMAQDRAVLSEKFLQHMYVDAMNLYSKGVTFPLTEFYEIVTSLGPKPGPEDCCPECKGSGTIEHKQEATHLSQYGNVVRDFYKYDYSTSACAKCGGRGYLMPWQIEEPEGAQKEEVGSHG